MWCFWKWEVDCSVVFIFFDFYGSVVLGCFMRCFWGMGGFELNYLVERVGFDIVDY